MSEQRIKFVKAEANGNDFLIVDAAACAAGERVAGRAPAGL